MFPSPVFVSWPHRKPEDIVYKTITDCLELAFPVLGLQLDRVLVGASTRPVAGQGGRRELAELLRLAWKFLALAGQVLDTLKDKVCCSQGRTVFWCRLVVLFCCFFRFFFLFQF